MTELKSERNRKKANKNSSDFESELLMRMN